jgi:hypothetical protein
MRGGCMRPVPHGDSPLVVTTLRVVWWSGQKGSGTDLITRRAQFGGSVSVSERL